jgi:hypothetical protein
MTTLQSGFRIGREFDQGVGSFSPDSRWIAYESNESGRYEVYIQPFPESGEWLQISLDGSADPRWRADGKEVFYVAPDGTLMATAVSVNAGNKQIQPGKPTPLFRTLLGTGGRPHGYDVDRAGQRFLIPTPVEKNLRRSPSCSIGPPSLVGLYSLLFVWRILPRKA